MYSFVICIYLMAVKLVSLFNKKVRLMVRGHAQVFRILREHIEPDAQYIWFHAASLGEFEQGRPLMERIRRDHPEYKILLTFFSPSGYEVRKNYAGADVICYLPFDTPRNVRRFLKLAHPCMAFFIKYEFWQNYLKGLQRRGVPTYSVSSIFALTASSRFSSRRSSFPSSRRSSRAVPCSLPAVRGNPTRTSSSPTSTRIRR